MSQKLFGTDGVRGHAGTPPLDPRTVRRIGAALVRALPPGLGAPHVLIGRDTRESGDWIERELAHGATSLGAHVTSAGVIPTPAVAYLTGRLHFVVGLVISASHNPFEDNGIKVFAGTGEKFTESLEARVEAIVADTSWETPGGDAPAVRAEDVSAQYLDHVRRTLDGASPPHARRIAVDCAHGATVDVAPRLLRDLGFDVVTMGHEPDGRNINLNCGSTHPAQVARLVVAEGCQLGVAFDGDGDRAILIDAQGRIVDGDAILYVCARQMQVRGTLRGGRIAATVMSNIGLEIALGEIGIGMVRCPVGDKFVMEEMQRSGLAIGGEQSGHIIFMDTLFTGDGLVTALNVLRVMAETGQSLAELTVSLKTYPQVLVNVRVREKRDWTTLPAIAAAADRVEQRLAGRGRLLVRYSGTEPLLRVMIEGEHQDEIDNWAEEIAGAVRAEIGA
jgi:phosphoglucosamine mutase